MNDSKFWYKWIAIIGVGSLSVRLLINYKFEHSALLYVGIPFLFSLALIATTSTQDEEASWYAGYWNLFRNGMIGMLASSIVLFEGFLCVAFFIPIFLFCLLLGLVSEYLWRRFKNKKGGVVSAHIFPLLVLLSAAEGTHEVVSFERNHEVSSSRVVSLSISEIKSNLIKPIDLNKERPWLLNIFPQPYRIDAETLNEGDVHKIYYRYHRWFVTNTHEGKTLLKLSEVSDYRVKTEFIEDTSYLSNYLRLEGTTIDLEPIDSDSTKVTLSVRFERKLDPSWYFKPLEEYGVKKTAEFLIKEVVARDG